MKTPVIMKRPFIDGEVSQNSKTGYLSLTDLLIIGNKWRVENNLPIFNQAVFFQTKSIKEFIKYLENEAGESVKINSKGKNSHTWLHPYLFIDVALSINPKLKIKVYKWITDELLKYRNDSGDSYKKLTGAIYDTISNKSDFKTIIKDVANKIKEECNVKDWQKATEEQLKLRDKIYNNIFVLSDILKDIDNLVEIAIKKAMEN